MKNLSIVLGQKREKSERMLRKPVYLTSTRSEWPGGHVEVGYRTPFDGGY
jgi:hypothetical protein